MNDLTRTSAPSPMSASDSSSPSWIEHGRFAPGAVLEGRYRVIELLGKGGMGEVYRADDLKLGQSVALKFLTVAMSADPSRVADMHNEVRISRQVSHPNVCRVYDIGEIEGHPFITMEYVDGENLASLLRRIGRLPNDKAIEIARQLCAGLAVAHESGVLHRDLKPTNVMIDGRGKVRITDFGLAVFATTVAAGGADIRAGTPAYMSPEQFKGRAVTAQSDIYSLGLVLFEMFTGKRVVELHSPDQLAKSFESSFSTPPSSLVPDFDPSIERIILRCLERDPHRRPPSALAVAAALPGGDPLAAALAAGETPSPGMVCDAGVSGGLCSSRASALVVLALALCTAGAWLARMSYPYSRVALEKPPAVLADRARELLSSLGYAGPIHDRDYGYAEESEYIEHLAQHDRSPLRWEALSNSWPAAMWFWYRESPEPLLPLSVRGTVTPSDPPPVIPGETLVTLDPRGRLLALRAEPALRSTDPLEHPTGTAGAADSAEANWPLLLTAAGLSIDDLRPVAPHDVPPVYCNARAAFEGKHPEAPHTPLRVELGAFDGRAVYFAMHAPWQAEHAAERAGESGWLEPLLGAAYAVLIVASLIGGGVLAWQNVKLGRGDPRGARRLGFYAFITYMFVWLFSADHVLDLGAEWGMAMRGASTALFFAAWMWAMYMAMEPYVRRWWPETIISWSRLLHGRFRDPLIGRDVLLGVAGGAGLACLGWLLIETLPRWLGLPTPCYPLETVGSLTSPRHFFALLLETQFTACRNAMLALVLMLLCRVLLRRPWPAIVLVAIIYSLLQIISDYRYGATALYANLATNLLVWGVLLYGLVRFGLLTVIVAHFTMLMIGAFPTTFDPGQWYFGVTIAIFATLTALLGYGFFTALAGQPLLRDALRTPTS